MKKETYLAASFNDRTAYHLHISTRSAPGARKEEEKNKKKEEERRKGKKEKESMYS